MIVLGLTGSIGMGKSVAAKMFCRLGVAVFDSDACVHVLTRPGGPALPAIARTFPGIVRDGVLDRISLGRTVFADSAALRRLENILHPLVRQARVAFVRRARARRRPLVVFDVPLLFETGGEKQCDAVVVISAPAFVQRQRALARSGMTADKLLGILARQTSDGEKRRRADFVIPSGLGRRFTLNAIRHIVRMPHRRRTKR
ncbi:MAG: dephospho-CoA kinase [Alphaproteobacteria bacterium]|nr:dephospho-CoA kinase [Alphaproteobacteria bacterium]